MDKNSTVNNIPNLDFALEASFYYIDLRNARLTADDLAKVDITKCDLSGVDFKVLTLEEEENDC